jgi:hypothetical protein
MPAQPNVPAVQLVPMRGDVIKSDCTGTRKAVDALIREPLAVRGEWDDPSDTNTRSRSATQVSGYRRNDPLLTLWVRGGRKTGTEVHPNSEVTALHIRAAERYRDDFEIANGAQPGYERGEVRGSSSPGAPSEFRLHALRSYRAATTAVGARLSRILVAIVLGREDLSGYAEAFGISAHSAKGYLIAALDRLLDHYEPVATGAAERV